MTDADTDRIERPRRDEGGDGHPAVDHDLAQPTHRPDGAIGYDRLCVDGPVMTAERLAW